MTLPLHRNLNPLGVGRGSGAAAWTPAEWTGLTFWLDPAQDVYQDVSGVTPATDDGHPVRYIAEQSVVNNFVLTQNTLSVAPTYRPTAGPNSTPTLDFDGGDGLVRANTAVLDLVGADTGTIYLIIKQRGSSNFNQLIFLAGAGSDLLSVYATFTDTLYYDHGAIASGGRVFVNQPVGWDDTWHKVRFYRNGSMVTIEVDGVQLLNSTFSDTLANGLNTLMIAAAGGFGGWVAEILISNVAESADEKISMNAYISDKYGL
jgi:hypothetical protein